MAEGEVIVQWGLYGAPRLGPSGRFASVMDQDGMDSRLGAAYATILASTGEWYKEQVGLRFNQEHGRTGVTAESIEGEGPFIESRDLATYTIAMGGTVWAVIKPLPTHEIQGPILGGGPTPQMHPLRDTNLYSPFAMASENDYLKGPITWFQGSEESHSPDITWYTSIKDELAAEAQRRLFMLAGIAQQLWSLDNVGLVPWTRGEAITSWKSMQAAE